MATVPELGIAGPGAASSRFNAAMLQGKAVHFLLDITWAGRTFHLSRSTIVVPSTASGEDILYEGLILDEIEWDESIELFSDVGETVSIGFSVNLPVNVPKLIAEGYQLTEATGELSMWVEGTNYEDRRVLLIGRFLNPEYAWEDEPINVVLQREFFEDRALLPQIDKIVTTSTWPDSPAENTLDLSYPIVFGIQPTSGVGNTKMSPALLTRTSISTGTPVLVVANHATLAGNVEVSSATDTKVLPVILGADTLGNVVSIVDDPGAAGLSFGDDDAFFISWNQGVGALANRTGDGPLSGGGDLTEFLLNASTLPVDVGRTAAAKQYLNPFKFAGVIAEPVSPFEFLQANLAPFLPMSIVMGAEGLYPIPWRFDATLKDVVERLDVDIDPSIELVGSVAYEGSIKDIVNEFRLRFALDMLTGEMSASLLLSGSRIVGEDLSTVSLYCRQSQSQYGVRAMEAESTLIYDPGTAALVVAWWARAKAFPTRVIRYAVGYDRAWLERGGVVSITDSNLHLTDQIALIETMVFREDATILLTLRIVEDVAVKLNNAGV